MSLVLLMMVGSWALQLTTGYPTGPDLTHCHDMYPFRHDSDAQESPTPYSIHVSATSYNPGDTIRLTVNGSVPFRGLMLQARSLDHCADFTPLGTFSLAQDETELQLYKCSNANDTVGHNNATDKVSRTFTWHAPSQSAGHLYFRATFVQTFREFWTTTHSAFISDPYDFNLLPNFPCDVRDTLVISSTPSRSTSQATTPTSSASTTSVPSVTTSSSTSSRPLTSYATSFTSVSPATSSSSTSPQPLTSNSSAPMPEMTTSRVSDSPQQLTNSSLSNSRVSFLANLGTSLLKNFLALLMIAYGLM